MIVSCVFMALLLLSPLTPIQAQDKQSTKGKPCYIGYVTERAICHSITVPLDHNTKEGATIDLHVVVLPATGSIVKKDPFFVYAGGPGQAASEQGALVSAAFHKIREERPIVLMDQRGTGQSNPLKCAMEGYVPSADGTRQMVKDCIKKQTIDVRHFDSWSIIEDTEIVRKTLGYDQLNIWGGSFGTRLGAYYAMDYPGSVRSLIMDGVLPTDVSLYMSAPESAERALTLLIETCANNKQCEQQYPELRQQISDLIARADAGNLVFEGPDPITGDTIMQPIESSMIIEAIRANMYVASYTLYIPFIVDQAANDNLVPLVTAFMNGTAVADSMYIGSTLSILCQEEVPRVPAATVKEAAKTSFASDSYLAFWATACENWPAKAMDVRYHKQFVSDIPTLVLSGNLDPVTPPTLGDIMMKGLSNAHHIVVSGTGHNTSHIGCMPTLMKEFVNGLAPAALDDSCLGTYKAENIFLSGTGTTKAINTLETNQKNSQKNSEKQSEKNND